MAYHIKRDGVFLCRLDKLSPWGYKREKRNYITFSQAHRSKLEECCGGCKKRYYEILNSLKNPIIIT